MRRNVTTCPSGVPSAEQDLVLWITCDVVLGDGRFEDRSGRGHHASCDPGRCPRQESGARGQACVFDGLDDYLRVPYANDFDKGEALSIVLWVKRPANAYGTFIAKPIAGNRIPSWSIFLWDGDLMFQGFPLEGLGATTPWPSQEWRLAALVAPYRDPLGQDDLFGILTRNPSYLPSEHLSLAAGQFSATVVDESDVLIGAGRDVSGALTKFFPGQLDEIRIYRRVVCRPEFLETYLRP